MDALLRKQRALYAGAQDALSEWASAQAALSSLLATACSVVARLRLLARDELYGALQAPAAVPELCRRRQLEALEGVLCSAYEQVRAALLSCQPHAHRRRALTAAACSCKRSQPWCTGWRS